ncbi:MAG: SgcJ/EcaC family oxidoreductase [Planctomycetota bacterium]
MFAHRSLTRFGFFLAVPLLVAAHPPCRLIHEARADQPAGNSPQGALANSTTPFAAEEAAIRQSSKEFEQAFTAANAAALAAAWTEQGEFRDDAGTTLRGRAEIEKAYANMFAKMSNPKAQVTIDSIRFPSGEMAVERGSIQVSHAGPELPAKTHYEAIHTREGGKWKLAFVREWHGEGNDLQEIAWLEGKWHAKWGDEEFQFSFEWNSPKTFLLSRFVKKRGNEVLATGSQRIGVDPRTGQLRSWHFDEDGAFGESVWYQDRTSWIMDSIGVTADGAQTASISILTRLNDNGFTLRSVDRWIEGVQMPDTKPLRVIRTADAPASTPAK